MARGQIVGTRSNCWREVKLLTRGQLSWRHWHSGYTRRLWLYRDRHGRFRDNLHSWHHIINCHIAIKTTESILTSTLTQQSQHAHHRWYCRVSLHIVVGTTESTVTLLLTLQSEPSHPLWHYRVNLHIVFYTTYSAFTPLQSKNLPSFCLGQNRGYHHIAVSSAELSWSINNLWKLHSLSDTTESNYCWVKLIVLPPNHSYHGAENCCFRFARREKGTLWRPCNLTSFPPCLTGPVNYPFAFGHKGPGFKSPGEGTYVEPRFSC